MTSFRNFRFHQKESSFWHLTKKREGSLIGLTTERWARGRRPRRRRRTRAPSPTSTSPSRGFSTRTRLHRPIPRGAHPIVNAHGNLHRRLHVGTNKSVPSPPMHPSSRIPPTHNPHRLTPSPSSDTHPAGIRCSGSKRRSHPRPRPRSTSYWRTRSAMMEKSPRARWTPCSSGRAPRFTN